MATNDCTGPCPKKKPDLTAITTGAAILGLTVAGLVGCPPERAQPAYGVAQDDDDSAMEDDDDSTDPPDQPLYGTATDPD